MIFGLRRDHLSPWSNGSAIDPAGGEAMRCSWGKGPGPGALTPPPQAPQPTSRASMGQALSGPQDPAG